MTFSAMLQDNPVWEVVELLGIATRANQDRP